MNHLPENHIAAQALKALRLRRQLDCGALTHQEYVACLDALEAPPEQAVAPAPQGRSVFESDVSKSGQTARDTRSRLIGALAVLELRRRQEHGQPPPREELPLLPAQTDLARLPAEVPAAFPADAPAAEASAPAAPAMIATTALPQPRLAPKSPGNMANLLLGWKRRPRNHRLRWLLASTGGTFVLIAALQALTFRSTGVSQNSGTQETAVIASEVLPADLTVAEAGFVGPAERSRVAGVLRNRSGKSYTDIQVTFSLVGPDGDTVGLTTATVDHIGGHETAAFESLDGKPKAAELVLRGIETHPR